MTQTGLAGVEVLWIKSVRKRRHLAFHPYPDSGCQHERLELYA